MGKIILHTLRNICHVYSSYSFSAHDDLNEFYEGNGPQLEDFVHEYVQPNQNTFMIDKIFLAYLS